MRAQAICAAQGQPGREGRRWQHLCQLEEELSQLARSTDQVVEVFHFVGDEDSPRRVLCPWRVHPAASTLPAVARATAGRFVRCEYLTPRPRALLAWCRGAVVPRWCVLQSRVRYIL